MKERQGSDKMSVLNPANASSFIKSINEYAEFTKTAWDNLQPNSTKRATMSNEVLHHKLKDKLTDTIQSIRTNMVNRFIVHLPFDDMQSMMMRDATLYDLQRAGSLMAEQYTSYSYKLGEKVTIRLSCRGGEWMPTILFPNEELTIFSEDFLDLVRPLYLITKSWMDVTLAFEAVCKLVTDTRELNFFVPWLRLILPQDQDLTNQFNAPFRVSRWLELDMERRATVDKITQQVKYILNNEHTTKRTWMPSELVQMVRQGNELITQYNIMKSVSVPDTHLKPDCVAVEIIITAKDHPTISWATQSSSYKTMKEVERLRTIDAKKRKEEDRW